jgi:hypothetical protein
MVSPTTAQPDNNLAGSSVGNVNLIKPTGTKIINELDPNDSSMARSSVRQTLEQDKEAVLLNNEENQKHAENETSKKILPPPAPIPPVNVWQERMNAQKVTNVTTSNDKEKEVLIDTRKRIDNQDNNNNDHSFDGVF